MQKIILDANGSVLLMEEEPKISTEEALRIFHKYAGSIKGDVDLESKKDEYFNEKHNY